ncbi:hypothetical protein ACFLZN_00100 [Nanoarchaeota archaeon]
MKKTTLEIITYMTIYLVITLPLVIAQPVTPTNTSTNATTPVTTTPVTTGPLKITVDMPKETNKHRVDVNITTNPGVEVKIFVNDELRRTIFEIPASGNMFSKSLPLPSDDNTVRFVAKEGNNTAEFVKKIRVDDRVPDIKLNIPKVGRGRDFENIFPLAGISKMVLRNSSLTNIFTSTPGLVVILTSTLCLFVSLGMSTVIFKGPVVTGVVVTGVVALVEVLVGVTG